MAATENYADFVFEGGGVKGVGLAGALATLEERGYRPQNDAGTSAGAISAALLAAGYSAAELREIILNLDYRQFQDKGWEDKVPLIERSLSMLLDLGLYEGDFFLEWIRERLEAKGVRTFADLVHPEYADDPRFRSRLQVIASDVTKHELLVLPLIVIGLAFSMRSVVTETLVMDSAPPARPRTRLTACRATCLMRVAPPAGWCSA